MARPTQKAVTVGIQKKITLKGLLPSLLAVQRNKFSSWRCKRRNDRMSGPPLPILTLDP
jgi:hypothetical protein